MFEPMFVVITAGTTITLMAVNTKLMQLFRPKVIEDHNCYESWKWNNITTSLLHSFIVGFGVLNVIAFERSLMFDMLRGQTGVGNGLICISTGYFVYDLLLSLTNLQYPGRVEIIVHHLITLSCLVVSLWQMRFLGYCLVGLTVEISSFFIHVREVLLMSGHSKSSNAYTLNTILTIITLVQFRFVPLGWIAVGIYDDRSLIEWPLLAMAVVFLAIIFLVSSVLLYRVIASDFHFNVSHDLLHWFGINSSKLQYKCSSKLRRVL